MVVVECREKMVLLCFCKSPAENNNEREREVGEEEVNVHQETKLPCTVIMGEIRADRGGGGGGGNAILCSSTSSSSSFSSSSASSCATLASFGVMIGKCCCSSEFLTRN